MPSFEHEVDLYDFADAYGGYKELAIECMEELSASEIESVLTMYSVSKDVVTDLYEAYTNKNQEKVNQLLVDLFDQELGRIA